MIETYGDNPKTIILAEWEWDEQSIFREGKELDKLWEGIIKHPNANAFLFTYFSVNELYELIKNATKFWQGKANTIKRPPTLFLSFIAYEQVNSFRDLKYLRTVEIRPKDVKLWSEPLLSIDE